MTERLPDDPRLSDFVDAARRRLQGIPEPERDNPADYEPGGAHWTPPVDPTAFRRALAAETAYESDDGGTEEPPYDPNELDRFAAASAEAMGFGAQAQEPATTQEAAFAAADEAGQDGRWTAWFASLSAEDRNGALAGDPAAIDSFARWIEESSAARLGAVADQIPGARLVEDPLHRRLSRIARR